MFEKVISFIYTRIYYPTKPNLLGDRLIEYSFIAANIPPTKKNLLALDFGSSTGEPALIAARLGYKVHAIDLLARTFHYRHKNVEFEKLDILNMQDEPKYNLVIVCSTIEHVGLKGRYNIANNIKDGDLKAAKKVFQLLCKGGQVILTLPVGKDGVYKNLHRVYGKERLPKLLKGFKIKKEEYWTKEQTNSWFISNKKTALATRSSAQFYSFGLFVLEK